MHKDKPPPKYDLKGVEGPKWLLALVSWFCLSVAGCSGKRDLTQAQDEVVAWVRDAPIYASVVRQISRQRGISQAKALDHAADTLRLYFAYQEDLKTGPDFPQLEKFLTLQTAVRVWLESNFEPEHDASHIPRSKVKSTLEKVSKQGRPFGPEMHGLCQVIVRPANASPQDDARLEPGFQEAALSVLADMEQGLRLAQPELLNSERCKLFDQLTELIAAEHPEQLQLKRESLLLDLSSKSWDEDFVAKVAAAEGPGLLDPFMTRFGLHLVYVSKIFPAHLEADHQGKVSPKVNAQREQEMRSLMLERWRSEQLKELLEELRKRELIEWELPA